VLARVFEPFFTTKDAGKGTGLGLAMVHSFAEQAGGHTKIDSRIGEGTSVTIVLPGVRAESAVDFGKEKSHYDASPVQERVLVVEDEQPVREFISAQLRGLGYTVTAV
jgi:hypothetical protein